MDANGCASDRSDVQRPGHDILFGAVWISIGPFPPVYERGDIVARCALDRRLPTVYAAERERGRMWFRYSAAWDVAEGPIPEVTSLSERDQARALSIASSISLRNRCSLSTGLLIFSVLLKKFTLIPSC